MIRLATRLPSYMLFRATGKPKMLPFNLTVSVSYNCNSRCKTCNIWKKKADDLTLEEFEKVFKKIGKGIFWVTLSGGEPFLRKDLVGITDLIYKHCKPKIINIPTNGLLGKAIAEKAAKIAKSCPKSDIVINLSLDGIGAKHDEIRGVPGNFERAMDSYKALRALKLPNLSIGVHTVISQFNIKDIPEICDFVIDELKPDSYISEVAEARVELDTINAGVTPNAEEYAKAVEYIMERTESIRTKGISRLTKALRMSYYEHAKKALAIRKQPIPCYAGFASAQISPEGDVWGCCVRAEPLGSLRENDYDFRRIWFSEKADRFRQSVRNGECACPLANAYYSSAVCEPLTLLRTTTVLLR